MTNAGCYALCFENSNAFSIVVQITCTVYKMIHTLTFFVFLQLTSILHRDASLICNSFQTFQTNLSTVYYVRIKT